MSKKDWDNFSVSKPFADWTKKPATEDKDKVATRRRIEEIEEEKRFKEEFDL